MLLNQAMDCGHIDFIFFFTSSAMSCNISSVRSPFSSALQISENAFEAPSAIVTSLDVNADEIIARNISPL